MFDGMAKARATMDAIRSGLFSDEIRGAKKPSQLKNSFTVLTPHSSFRGA